jgi:antitoxin ParD1/3/4
MKITLELTPDMEVKLRESAARQDGEAIRCMLAEILTPTVEALLQKLPTEPTDGSFEALADELADQLAAFQGADAPPLSDYAVSRQGIYEEHP